MDQNSFLESLYCSEEKWEIETETETETEDDRETAINNDHDFFWDDEELQSLFIKERETYLKKSAVSVSVERREAVEWILRINGHYGFSPLTAILAVNYLDRFLESLSYPRERKPWMMQLSAVTCLSLAAKVEETDVPLLLDLQVEDAKYIFEAKNIQKMELLVLSGLKWRMNPVTPLSFLDHIIRRLGLKTHSHWEFLRGCENLLLSIVADSRFTIYLPSVMATAIMLHVIHRFEFCNAVDYENQLLGVLKISKEEVDECYDVIAEVLSNTGFDHQNTNLKRKIYQVSDSPDCVMDTLFTSDDSSSDDSWTSSSSSSSSCMSSTSSSHETIFKKRRLEEILSPH